MKFEVANEQINKFKTQAGIILVFEEDCKDKKKLAELDKFSGGKISALIEKGEMGGKFKEYTYLRVNDLPCENLLIIGLGKEKDFTLDKLRGTVAIGCRYFRRIKINEIAIPVFTQLNVEPKDSACCIVEGMLLGLYKFWKYITSKDPNYVTFKKITILTDKKTDIPKINEGIKKGQILAEASNFARDLTNEPGNRMNPTIFAKIAEEKAKELKLSVKVFTDKDLEKEGMGGIIAVGQGSVEPPRLVILEYKGGGKGSKTLGLIGKGVTFDSGGINLKPSDSLSKMHCDMAGAASVLALMTAVARLKPEINIIAAMPLAENMLSGNAIRPGDIIKMYSGKTVEILNTDAEGRLILADALAYIAGKKVDMMIDIATLTGAILVALGRFAAGIFSNDKKLAETIFNAGEKAGERVWELPLYNEYKDLLKSDVADLQNIGGRDAGSISAAWFLREFVDSIPWVHIDIAGTSTMEKTTMPYLRNPYLPKEGATGFGTRLLYYTIENLSEKLK